MTVTVQSPYALRHDGEPVYFCSAGCKSKFAADPSRYPLITGGSSIPATAPTPSAVPAELAATGSVYTCLMPPEVRHDHLGACPKCGMALEPEMPALGDAESPELVE